MPNYRRAYTPGGGIFLTLVTFNRRPIFAVIVGLALPTFPPGLQMTVTVLHPNENRYNLY
jgi:hypothetical protein